MNPADAAAPAKFGDYLELTKPRLSLLSVLTALVGYYAARPAPDGWRLVFLLIGTSLAAGGVASLNQWMERDTDARMKRTADRPIPSGKVPDGSAFVLGLLMCIAALFLLFAKVNPLAALFTLLTIVSYLCWYTPAKRWSRWSTEIGAIAGAFPPLIGWAAGEGRVTTLGWILFGILFFWQIPHFMAVAWTHRRDYTNVAFPMLPVRDESGAWVAGWSFANTVFLVGASLLPSFLGLATPYYAFAAAVAGLWFLWRAGNFLKPATRDAAARKLFLTSIAYLPILLGALVADRLIFKP
ncbi:MAG: protoheme farnesyltransferase [Verrucomicrobia bacterium]|nr:protoheme farnesyltransferase [Verrucomicrobiota bacterium]